MTVVFYLDHFPYMFSCSQHAHILCTTMHYFLRSEIKGALDYIYIFSPVHLLFPNGGSTIDVQLESGPRRRL